MRLTLETRGLTCDRDARTVTGVMLPYGETGNTNLGKVTASAGTLEVVEGFVANLEHDHTRPVARLVSTDETDAGMTGTFTVAETRAGDDLLAEASAGLRTGLSVEVSDPVIRAGALVAGTIDGCAFVTRPAFPSAQLAAADVGEDPEDDEDDEDEDPEVPVEDPEDADVDLEAETLEVTPETTVADLADAITDPAAPDPATPDQEGSPVTASAAPLAASAAVKPKGLKTVREFANRFTAATRTGDRAMLASLADITQSGIGGDVAAQAFLGELWSGKTYARRFVPLMDTARSLEAYSTKGWRWVTKPEVYTYAGNKAAVTSEVVDTESVEVTASRLAGAHDIDRKFVDFGDVGFLESYLRAMTESYARKSDAAGLAFLESSATAVTAGSVPTGVHAAAAAIVDGALALVDVGAPTFAIVGDDAYRSLVLTPRDQVLEFLSMSLGLEDGSMAGFRIVPGGSALSPAQIIVGIKGAASFLELPGSPIRVDALNIANGGVDQGLFGYYATMLNDADGLVKTQPKAASISAGADFAMTVGDADGSAGPTVIATYADGSTADVTDDAVLTSATPAKATIVANLVHAVAAGTSVITATYQGLTDTVTVTVS